ncbi:uncharacterized protein LOC126882503 [Diabrotica virgifera virgifera]|uniref:Uncharacterized protein n=1 Tax=Diabrotica virgifera virgifera TaxID=50390 RepID=A0ABM5JZQ8_DIAVI|nr:uncharacterized protein LOC126882503 [Diabrotica virgifera virgifera]
MSYKHLSGSEKRKKQKLREQERHAQKDAILSYFTSHNSAQKGSSSFHLVADQFMVTNESDSKNKLCDEGRVAIKENDNSTVDFQATSPGTSTSPSSAIEKNNVSISFPSDIGDWPRHLNLEFQEYFINNQPNQNIDKIGECVTQLDNNKTRHLQSAIFYETKANGEKILREWLVYSPT